MAVYVIQYHLAAAEAALVNIENQLSPESGAVSSESAEAGEYRHPAQRAVRRFVRQNGAVSSVPAKAGEISHEACAPNRRFGQGFKRSRRRRNERQ